MILVREVFQLKVGKAKEAKALLQEAAKFMKKYGMPQGRALTDLTGPFYTLVFETEYPNLAAWESSTNDPRAAEDFGAWYQKFAPLLETGGRREIFTIVE
ncbi:MAG TPA: hypothetical protein VH763_19155 [Gemmatimonadales bacterium]|jgi:hypothetical protein